MACDGLHRSNPYQSKGKYGRTDPAYPAAELRGLLDWVYVCMHGRDSVALYYELRRQVTQAAFLMGYGGWTQ